MSTEFLSCIVSVPYCYIPDFFSHLVIQFFFLIRAKQYIPSIPTFMCQISFRIYSFFLWFGIWAHFRVWDIFNIDSYFRLDWFILLKQSNDDQKTNLQETKYVLCKHNFFIGESYCTVILITL